MNSAGETISGKVNAAMLEKADRLFRNDDDGVWIELLQNSRRAGASSVDVTIEEPQPNAASCLITIQDDGTGVDNFQNLLTLGASDWSVETEVSEDPAGMGFFALCRSEVEVHSGTRVVKISPSVFLGKGEARLSAPRLSEGHESALSGHPPRAPWWERSNGSQNSIR
ncbi:MAG TPA: ATP-binding protein [Candidatus Sulfotelmatobacter sp.]